MALRDADNHHRPKVQVKRQHPIGLQNLRVAPVRAADGKARINPSPVAQRAIQRPPHQQHKEKQHPRLQSIQLERSQLGTYHIHP